PGTPKQLRLRRREGRAVDLSPGLAQPPLLQGRSCRDRQAGFCRYADDGGVSEKFSLRIAGNRGARDLSGHSEEERRGLSAVVLAVDLGSHQGGSGTSFQEAESLIY